MLAVCVDDDLKNVFMFVEVVLVKIYGKVLVVFVITIKFCVTVVLQLTY